MADNSLHLPVDWERKMSVRRLELGLYNAHSADKKALAPIYFLRMWTEWASNPEEWRPLRLHVDAVETHPWAKEDIALIIEDACRWDGTKGTLMRVAIEAGVYSVEQRGEISGLAMPEWLRLNPHLLPSYESMQSKGGRAARLTVQRKQADGMAAQQQEIFVKHAGGQILAAQTESVDEQRKALALVIQVDRNCGRAVRGTSQYSETILRDAVSIIRRHPPGSIDAVLSYLHENLDTPAVIKVPDRVLEDFDKYLEAATAEAK